VPGCLKRRRDGLRPDRLLRQPLGIEARLRDTKDLRFGMGMGGVHVSAPERRNRRWQRTRRRSVDPASRCQ
jgi:hypothetical protein